MLNDKDRPIALAFIAEGIPYDFFGKDEQKTIRRLVKKGFIYIDHSAGGKLKKGLLIDAGEPSTWYK